jgi:ATP-dependent DNA helicase RecQ
MSVSTNIPGMAQLREVIERHWGYQQLRPLQQEAMQAVLDGQDSLVVLPTGGGKSLCYQAPAVALGGTTVVISPLIALMKDQVDSLRACGVAALQLDSSLTAVARHAYEQELRQGNLRLLFVSPERLVQTDLYQILQQIQVHTFAIDEAHCISHWGHDFRKEYRQLSRLREFFPDASVHAYTATATEQVRQDIIKQLALREPVVLVGNFDRPNLTFRVLPRHDLMKQVGEVLERHTDEAGIIYCPRRKDVDDIAQALKDQGLRALPYHAGLTAEQRQATQEEFLTERCDVMVATVAFGMGIDRSNVRFVLHTGMPKSLEHYQQEAGRAGRDGLEAECVLLYSGGDVFSIKSMLRKSAAENEAPPDFLTSSLRHLDEIDRYCRGACCRHKALVQYFGQDYENTSCKACDLCLGDTEEVPEATVVAQKILSCVARVKQGFGINQVVGILRGENTENIRKRGHEKLSTYGLLEGRGKADVRDWIYQMIGQEVLVQTEDEYPLLKLNAGSWEVLRGQRQVRLIQLVRRKKGDRPGKSSAEAVTWEGVDRELFEVLRGLRRTFAAERQVPPYVIFHDNVLRDLARIRPSTPERMRSISGIGEAKMREFGERFLKAIKDHAVKNSLAMDVSTQRPPLLFTTPPKPAAPLQRAAAPAKPVPPQMAAVPLFNEEMAIEDVMRQLGQTRTAVVDSLCEYIRREKPRSIAAWVDDGVYQRIAAAVRMVGSEKIRALVLVLGGQVAEETIRLVLAHMVCSKQ